MIIGRAGLGCDYNPDTGGNTKRLIMQLHASHLLLHNPTETIPIYLPAEALVPMLGQNVGGNSVLPLVQALGWSVGCGVGDIVSKGVGAGCSKKDKAM
jgi:hypothetical protein